MPQARCNPRGPEGLWAPVSHREKKADSGTAGVHAGLTGSSPPGLGWSLLHNCYFVSFSPSSQTSSNVAL